MMTIFVPTEREKVMGMREKLIEILEGNATCLELGIESCDACPYGRVEDCYTHALTDHLIANGVTIPVRCKDCENYDPLKERCDHPNLEFEVECYDHWVSVKPDDFCSAGERRTDGN